MKRNNKKEIEKDLQEGEAINQEIKAQKEEGKEKAQQADSTEPQPKKVAFSKPKNEKVEITTEDNNMGMGMSIGMAMGMFFSQMFDFNLSMGMCMGLYLGMVIGISIKIKVSTASTDYLSYMGRDFTGEEVAQFLEETEYIDFSDAGIQHKADELIQAVEEELASKKPYVKSKSEQARKRMRNEAIAVAMYTYVRDEIPHSHDIHSHEVPAKASQVLSCGTGICHAKSNLLAALLRYAEIPCGICEDHLTRGENDSRGYILHAFNAIWLNEEWVFVDARGNKEGVKAEFDGTVGMLAFPHKEEYDEFYYYGIFKDAHKPTMEMLENAADIDDIWEILPDSL